MFFRYAKLLIWLMCAHGLTTADWLQKGRLQITRRSSYLLLDTELCQLFARWRRIPGERSSQTGGLARRTVNPQAIDDDDVGDGHDSDRNEEQHNADDRVVELACRRVITRFTNVRPRVFAPTVCSTPSTTSF